MGESQGCTTRHSIRTGAGVEAVYLLLNSHLMTNGVQKNDMIQMPHCWNPCLSLLSFRSLLRASLRLIQATMTIGAKKNIRGTVNYSERLRMTFNL